MNIMIIDSDSQAIRNLKKLLGEISPEIKIRGVCTNAREAIVWLQSNERPDLILSSVELTDGLSMQVFRELKQRIPVVFICHHEKYAIETFKANGIYYLLKPVKKQELEEALLFYKESCWYKSSVDSPQSAGHCQERFLISVGREMKLIKAGDIAYFYTDNKIVYLVTFSNSKYLTEYTLERLEQLLDPVQFFRINRQFIINIAAIAKLEYATKSRFQVFLRPETAFSTITSFGRKDKFCRWMLGNLQQEDLPAQQY